MDESGGPSFAWKRCISVMGGCTSWCTSEGLDKKAEVRTLQSQLHSVNGRGASGDRVILPRSSVSEVLGDRDGLTFSKTIRNITSLQYSLISTKEELRTKATSASVDTEKESVKSKSRVFLQSKEVINLSLTDGPIMPSRDCYKIAKSLHVGDALDLPHVPGKWFTSTHRAVYQSHLHSPRERPLHLSQH